MFYEVKETSLDNSQKARSKSQTTDYQSLNPIKYNNNEPIIINDNLDEDEDIEVIDQNAINKSKTQQITKLSDPLIDENLNINANDKAKKEKLISAYNSGIATQKFSQPDKDKLIKNINVKGHNQTQKFVVK